MIDADGDYILKGHSFKNSSFFEFYKSYNDTDSASAQKVFSLITSSTGSLTMRNSRGENCILAYTPVAVAGGWTFLSLLPTKDLSVNTENWQLIGAVSAGLLLLFIIDLAGMVNFNNKLKAAAREAAAANRVKTDRYKTCHQRDPPNQGGKIMKKLLCAILAVCMLVSLAACAGKPKDQAAEGFKPTLDTATNCKTKSPKSFGAFFDIWYPVGESNPCYRRERAVS